VTPLRYLDCLVILEICLLANLELDDHDQKNHDQKNHDQKNVRSNPLLDGETVFQTADGNTRIYMMPYSKDQYMWQLSFPMDETEAVKISAQGSQALLDEARTKFHLWHSPILQILKATPVSLVSGYPVYDRAMLEPEQLQNPLAAAESSSSGNCGLVTLIGDACHPMPPFKGQGANQAMLDALSLANVIYQKCYVKKE
jgi:salicylate hydroxylase